MPGIDYSSAKFFDGPNSGFIGLGNSGNTSNQASPIIHLQNIEITFNNNTTDLQSFDSNFAVSRAITSQSFEATAEGYFTSSSENWYSGHSTYMTSTSTNAEELLDLAIAKRTDLKLVFKSGSKIKKVNVVIASYTLSASVGEVQTYSINFAGNGAVTSIA